MTKDFYADERALAAYVEKDWFDHILKTGSRRPAFEFAPFEPMTLYSDHHQRLAGFAGEVSLRAGLKAKTLLEIGSSLGRTFFEIAGKLRSLESATLVEPSCNLYSAFNRIFAGGDLESFKILKGNLALDEVLLNTVPIKHACSSIKLTSLHKSFQELEGPIGAFDLVVCANVIDQCHDHERLTRLLKSATTPGGMLLLSCTYQWNDKYTGNASGPVKDINELFDSKWKFLGETNLPFHVRVYERYWKLFLSHVVAYQKVP